jgi:hypothetical protein
MVALLGLASKGPAVPTLSGGTANGTRGPSGANQGCPYCPSQAPLCACREYADGKIRSHVHGPSAVKTGVLAFALVACRVFRLYVARQLKQTGSLIGNNDLERPSRYSARECVLMAFPLAGVECHMIPTRCLPHHWRRTCSAGARLESMDLRPTNAPSVTAHHSQRKKVSFRIHVFKAYDARL